jgi:hypothetical protein
MFDTWESDPTYPTLFVVNRTVLVNMQAALPGVGRRMGGVPMWCRGSGYEWSRSCRGVRSRGCVDFLCTCQLVRCDQQDGVCCFGGRKHVLSDGCLTRTNDADVRHPV